MRKTTQIAVWIVVGVALAAMPRAFAQTTQERALATIEKATGLKPITIPETGELGRETGGVLGYLTGQRRALGGTIVGSALD
jgi:hypothetical protein